MKKEVTWIDIKDEVLMQRLGIHPLDVEPRDPSVWTKTNAEKKQLRKLRNLFKEKMVGSIPKHRNIPIYGKLIVQIKKVEPFYSVVKRDGQRVVTFKSTYSFKCGQSDIPRILSKFENAVVYYKWMGKTYSPDQIPFWYESRKKLR